MSEEGEPEGEMEDVRDPLEVTDDGEGDATAEQPKAQDVFSLLAAGEATEKEARQTTEQEDETEAQEEAAGITEAAAATTLEASALPQGETVEILQERSVFLAPHRSSVNSHYHSLSFIIHLSALLSSLFSLCLFPRLIHQYPGSRG